MFWFMSILLLSHGLLALVNGQPNPACPSTIANAKRSDSTATLTFVPASQYTPAPPSNTPKVSGTDFTILAAGPAATDGLDVYLGPDFESKIKPTYDDKCSRDPKSPDCTAAIGNLFDEKQLGNQRRSLGLLTILRWVLRGIATAAIVQIFRNGPPKDNNGGPKPLSYYHIPLSNVDQTVSATTATALAFATGQGDPNAVIFDDALQDDEPPDDEVSIIAECGGDFTIHISQQFENRLADFVGMRTQGCPSPSKHTVKYLHRRIPDNLEDELIRCIVQLAVDIVFNVVSGALANLAPVRRDERAVVRRLGGNQGNQIMQLIAEQTDELRGQIGYSLGELAVLQRKAAAIAYYREGYGQDISTDIRLRKEDQDQSDQGLCPTKESTPCNDPECKGNNGKCTTDDLKNCDCADDVACPSDALEPECRHCGGDVGGGKCKGAPGIKQGCTCWTAQPFGAYAFQHVDNKEFADVQNALINLPDIPEDQRGDDPKPDCHIDLRRGLRGRDAKLLNMNPTLLTSLVKKTVCANTPFDIPQTFNPNPMVLDNTKADPADGNWDGFAGWKFNFFWTDKPGACTMSCPDIFNSFVNGPGGPTCSPNSHTIADHGKYELPCGTAEFQIIPTPDSGNPVPKNSGPPPGKGCPKDPYPHNPPPWQATEWAAVNSCDATCPDVPQGDKWGNCKKGQATCECNADLCKQEGRTTCFKA